MWYDSSWLCCSRAAAASVARAASSRLRSSIALPIAVFTGAMWSPPQGRAPGGAISEARIGRDEAGVRMLLDYILTLTSMPPSPDIEQSVIDVLKNVSRRPINPTPESDLLADLGFDSLQVMETVAEIEDR